MAFVKDRQLVDSFVIGNEVIHSWKRDKVGGLLVKLDFEKAYDSIDHSFLDYALEGMGFGKRWRGWMTSCIASPTLSTLVNGSPTKEFGLERGLRQGDPLSPYLFNIAVKVLNQLLKKARELNTLRGAIFGSGKEHITHLQFTDDTIIFLEPNRGYLLNLKRILRCYEMASGLRINFQKSCIIKVGKNLSTEIDWADLFRCKMTDLPITYLGLPLDANPSKKNFWNPVIQKIENRLAPWKSRFLSKGRRLVLIKAVLSSIPIFYMSAFKMPVGVAQKIKRIQRSFFWGDGVEKRKIHTVSWEMLCRGKDKGGLGISRMLDKNRGLLAKWIWRFGWEENTLWKRVLCAKYGMNIRDLRWEWNITSNPSHLVSSVSKLHQENVQIYNIITNGFKVVVGNGERARFWKDIYWQFQPLEKAFPRVFSLAKNKMGRVSEFGSWKGSRWEWEIQLRRPLFGWEIEQ
ncbi:hypothetical protein Dsin_011490 [Dipteronia sinensis]|uniref:Reverse transcriptase domain-containing protein n=1 Tax=Dipteronia sinensis TaxID=43782 RepID=A0AAE0AV89_9ROSI|nr:hypothetical protein Dsin_011490 [Dipteronia sinensis]